MRSYATRNPSFRSRIPVFAGIFDDCGIDSGGNPGPRRKRDWIISPFEKGGPYDQRFTNFYTWFISPKQGHAILCPSFRRRSLMARIDLSARLRFS